LWYPNTRPFRQDEPGAWGEMFERLTAGLATLATSDSAASEIGTSP
jgi:hypothetical protein